MTAVRMLARPGLRRRWVSWVVLGLLAGASVGLAAAGVAGARRTDRAVPGYVRAAHVPDAAILANDPAFDAGARARVARLPEVRARYPFMVPFAVVASPKGLDAGLLPLTAGAQAPMRGVIVAGRAPDPRRADEIVVNEVARDRFHLDLGSTVVYRQPDPRTIPGIPPDLIPPGAGPVEARLRVVGISDAPQHDVDSMPSAGFYAKYGRRLLGVVNEFVTLRHGERDLARLQADVGRIMGHPVNIGAGSDLFGTKKILNVSGIERNGLLLFPLVVVLGAGVLVGQALVRAVTASGGELDVWRALGVGRALAVPTLLLPTVITAAVGAVTAVVVAIALSPRFPIAVTRRYDLDLGFHADWPVLVGAALGLIVAVLGAAWLTAELLVRRGGAARRIPRPAAWRAALVGSLRPALQFGSRLAVEPGHGRRAVPVRSAFIGAAVGVVGVVGCLTFRAGLVDAVHDPQRSGVVWDHYVAQSTAVGPGVVAEVARTPGVDAVVDARWARAVRIAGRPTPAWATRAVTGSMPFVVLEGRAPRGPREVALAPTTMRELGLAVGDHVRVGREAGRSFLVVGRALVPASSHTDYDQSAWMTAGALDAVVPSDQLETADFVEDWVLVRDRRSADHAAIGRRLAAIGRPGDDHVGPAERPVAILSLGELRTLPFALAVFFALLGVATVAHALVTTVRRRRHDVAVLRALGFTRPNVRLAIAWQATLIAAVGVVVGVPVGVVAGRLVWRRLAEDFPVAYVSPIALVAVLLVVPIAIVVANLLAAGPAHAATRVHPARVLRAE